jgi:hypothetical protein
MVIVNAKADLLNKASGQIEGQTILSVAILPQTLERLNFDALDPSDSMTNFIHQMKFSKTIGFSPITSVSVISMTTISYHQLSLRRALTILVTTLLSP